MTRSSRLTSNIRARETGLLARPPGAVASLAYEIEGEIDSYKAMHDEPELSHKPHANHHARVRGQFVLLFVGEMESKVLPYSRGRLSADISNSRRMARGLDCPELERWRSHSPPRCSSNPLRFLACMPEIIHSPQHPPPMPVAYGATGWLEAPLGSPARDPSPGWPGQNCGLASALTHRPARLTLSKTSGNASLFCNFFFHLRRPGQ